jgi:hypothetical protein
MANPDVVSVGNGLVEILLGNGKHAPVLEDRNFMVSYTNLAWAAAAADFNGDGMLDLAMPCREGKVCVLLNTTK